jgi:hypothetical protein
VKATDEHRRARIARLVAVAAVLLGVILLHSPLCADGMNAATHMAVSTNMDVAAGAYHSHDMPEPGGTLATCLALIVTVLVAVAGLRAPGRRVAVRKVLSDGIMSLGAVWMRPPRLAELCVLRI